MAHECVILADCPGALIELCGISTLERLLRTLQRCGIERATILSSTSERIADEAMPSSTVAYCSCSRRKSHPQSWSIRLCRRNFNRW